MGQRALGLVLLFAACGSESDDVRTYTGSVLDVVFDHGHSNNGGTNVDPNGCNSPPPLIPAPIVDLFRRGLVANEIVTDTQLQALKVTAYGGAAGTSHGSELALGLALYPYVSHLAILKVAANDSRYTDWIEGGAHNAALQTAIADFRAQIALTYPAVTSIRWHRVTFLGTKEGNNVAGSPAACAAMPGLAVTLKTQVQGYIGGTFATDLVIRESSAIVGQAFLPDERAGQAGVAVAIGGTLVDIDDIITLAQEQSDGRHYTGPGQNAIGSRGGGIIAAAL